METEGTTTAELRGRLAEAPAPVVLEYIYQRRLKRDEAKLPYLTEANLAHVIMLARTRILREADAKALLNEEVSQDEVISGKVPVQLANQFGG